ncbi:MAG: endonuclease domain-containing protein [Candidatus Cloacimonadota bacterium]|nr:endonuclease domain-containing protein [Candidatus Cloacimonadota bacterium]
MRGNVLYKQVVRELRKKETLAEKKFWNFVRNRQINGMKFRRQYPIKFVWNDRVRYFIADFYCHESKLVIEIDGGIHELQRDYDILRTYIINQLGIQVIRFSNIDVMNDINKIEIKLKGYLNND